MAGYVEGGLDKSAFSAYDFAQLTIVDESSLVTVSAFTMIEFFNLDGHHLFLLEVDY